MLFFCQTAKNTVKQKLNFQGAVPHETEKPNQSECRAVPHTIRRGLDGVWLDKNEWAALEQKHLHDEIHKIFSSHWQRGIREETLKERFTKIYSKRFGADAYDTVKEFRAWLDQQENRAELIAYLEADDPYKL